jgi:hypothetical protein
VDAEEESLVRIAGRRAARRLREDAGTPEFGRLLILHAAGAAGDALIAIALAGSFFFQVPETEARDKVLLYLLLTMAPFAVVAPLLSRVLDHGRGRLRWGAVLSLGGRVLLAWALSSRLGTLYVFPLAFGVLVLSRAQIVVRGAILPLLVPEGRTLVAANATLAKIGAIAAIVAGGPGLLLINYPGVQTELLFAALVYLVGVLPALRLPTMRVPRELEARVGARALARSATIRQGVLSAGGLRFLVGFISLHLAFALRGEGRGEYVGLGVIVGAATLGNLIGALIAPRLRRRLKEEGIILAALVVAGAAGIVVGLWFSVAAAGGLVFAFAIASGASKLSFDSIVQRDVPHGARGWAFARFEAALQLAWVMGAVPPVIPGVDIPEGPGVLAAGLAANGLAILLVAGRHRARAVAL